MTRESAPNPASGAARALEDFVDLDMEGATPDVESFLLRWPSEIRARVREGIEEYLTELVPQSRAQCSLLPGVVLDDFRLVRRLGSGGMGSVWEAVQLGLDRKVALKVLSPRYHSSNAGVERFRREARTSGLFLNAHIPIVHAAGVCDGRHFIAQELFGEGETMADRIEGARSARARGMDAPERCLWLASAFASIAFALRDVHLAGIVHRDVKPANILVAPDGATKLSDFGLATGLGDDRIDGMCHPVGTSLYMSPEQCSAWSGRLDARTDIFSLGVSLYEALTLVHPFSADVADKIYARICSESAPPADVLSRDCPPELAEICGRSMEKAPADRYESADQMGQALRDWAEATGSVECPPET